MENFSVADFARPCYKAAMPERPLDLIDPFDDCDWLPARELFRRLGFEPVPPAALDDFQLRGRLWEFIYAMAGRRFYLYHTDHLSDRALYAWLHDEWLEEQAADIPPEAEWNCHIDATDFGNGLGPIIWLKYFATEKQRQDFAVEHSLKSLPAHEDPAHDRDRWLPGPPGIPPDADDGKLFFEEEEENEDDPLGLEAVDAEIAAEKTREELAAITGGEEPEGWQRPVDKLREKNLTLLPPAELTDETLTPKLWELLHNLALQGFYVSHTDHLSDREVYAELWTHGLRDEALLPGKCKTGGWFHDFLGSWGEDELQLWLRYYASDEDRAEHVKDWPNDTIPPKEKPPCNRDWRLPKGPF